MTDKTNELKCCPFCGEADLGIEVFDEGWKDRIRCHTCQAQGPPHRTKPGAIEAWNRRYDHAAAELRWIPVSERLPEVGQDVNFIVGGIPEKSPYAYENGRKLGGRYTSDGSFSVPGSAYPATHWMPMLDTEPAGNIAEVGEREGV